MVNVGVLMVNDVKHVSEAGFWCFPVCKLPALHVSERYQGIPGDALP
jgi:hypothetical protein